MIKFLLRSLIAYSLFCFTAYSQYEDFEHSDELVEEASLLPVGLSLYSYDQEGSYSHIYLNQPITVEFSNQPLTAVLKKLESVTSLKMIYSEDIITNKQVNLSFKDVSLKHILDELFSNTDVDYLISEKGKIVLSKQKKIDEKTGTIKGRVKDTTGELLIGANVIIKETLLGCATNKNGDFLVKKLNPGTYTVEVSFVGYKKETKKVVVQAGQTSEVNFTLESVSFQIGGIEVVATTELIPRDASSKTIISSAEIEHFQASSIGDVLDLVPGVQKTTNPGLGKTSQIAIRGDQADALSAFGTLVILDGVPLSNNANLQFEKFTSSQTGASNLGRGVDLRTIPADNIESIEVVSGLPSVRYGDVTAGIINVRTRIGTQPNRVKIKNNPDTREANLGGGFVLGSTGLSYNFNAAESERDIRKTGDEYVRLTGQTVFANNFFDDAFSLNNKFFGQMIFDEEAPKGDVWQTRNYNRGFTLGYSAWGKYKFPSEVSNLEYNLFLTYRRENSMRSRLIQSDIRILPNGDTVSVYIGKVETKGNEWSSGGRLEHNSIYFTGSFIHKFLIGSDIQYEANTGEGLIVDTLFNYYGAESGKIPYRFDDIPGQVLASIYAEDVIAGKLGLDFKLSLGFRYEMYRPYKFNLKGFWGDGNIIDSYQGTFFNPRMNLIVYITDFNQVRMSAGTSSKSPPMSSIYPPPEVFTWRDPVQGKNVYLRFDRRVPELKGYRESQVEVAYDHKFFGLMGITLSAYYKKRNNGPSSQTIPVFIPVTENDVTKVYYVNTYNLSQNLAWNESKGIEFSVNTVQIKPLNMEFRLVGSYNFMKSWSNSLSYDPNPDPAKGNYPNYHVPGMPIDTLIGFFYPSSGRWRDQILVNYFIKYTHPTIGLWVTFRAEQALLERTQNFQLKPVDFDLLTENAKLARLFDETTKFKYVKWLLNLNISKALFKGAEISFYVNNFLDDPAVRRYQRTYDPTDIAEELRNPSLFYGIEFSMIVDEFIK